MSSPYVGEIRIFAGTFAPVGWQLCQGQLLPISEYQALFTLIGTTYGGDGTNTFALPNLQSRVPIHQGTGTGLPNYVIGMLAGVEAVTLSTQTIPAHTHNLNGANVAAGANVPSGAMLLANEVVGQSNVGLNYGTYSSSTQVAMAPQAITPSAAGGQPHNNIQPYVAINYIMSLYGIFPSQG